MQQELDDRNSLTNLDGIRVEVDVLPSAITVQGLSTEAVHAEVESQLRRADVNVLRMGVFCTGDPHLQVIVRVSEGRSGMVSSHVEVNFLQIVFMRRNPAVTFNRARTWTANATISLGPVAELTDRVRRELTRQVEQFIDDYRLANP